MTEKSNHNSTGSVWWRRTAFVRWIIAVAILLVAIRIALPYATKAYVNHVLNKSKDYSGRISDVSMRLWHGGYRVHRIDILQRNGNIQAPLFSAEEVDFLIDWHELFHGSVVGEITAVTPRINFVVGPTPQQTQTGKDEQWDKMLDSLFPFKLNRVELTNGEVHFKDPYSTPPVDIYLSKIAATATNLTNSRDLKQKLPAGAEASATTLGGGELNLQVHMNVLKSSPAYEVNCSLTNVNVVALNDFLKAYGKFDADRGNFSLYTSVAADNGAYDGYFKVFFDNLKIFRWEKDKKKNILAFFWQAIVGGTAAIFKNHVEDQLATKVPISGTYNGSSVGVWTAIATLLENAFIHALVPKLDEAATVEKVDQENSKK